MAKQKNDPAVSGFSPIEVEPHVDKTFKPIEVTPYEPAAAPVAAPTPPPPPTPDPTPDPTPSPDAGENKEN